MPSLAVSFGHVTGMSRPDFSCVMIRTKIDPLGRGGQNKKTSFIKQQQTAKYKELHFCLSIHTQVCVSSGVQIFIVVLQYHSTSNHSVSLSLVTGNYKVELENPFLLFFFHKNLHECYPISNTENRLEKKILSIFNDLKSETRGQL